MIELADVSFRYPGQRVPALVGVSFTVAAGARFALLGVNGSGKTTLLTLLAGLRTPAAGTVRIAGFDLATRRREAQQRVAFVPQENAFYPTLTVAENLAFFAAMREVPSALRAGRIRDAVEVTVLGSLLSQRAGTLSGGQRRRLSIAGGLLGAPELLLLDEPTAGVDPEVRAQLVASIREIAERGTTLVYCSHHLDEVDALCTDVALLDAGRLRFHGTLAALRRASGAQRVRVTVGTSPDDALDAVRAAWPAAVRDGSALEIAPFTAAELPALLAALASRGATVESVEFGTAATRAAFAADAILAAVAG